ncbi:MAG: hypothetical protein U1E45_23170 [Geminicoccaceae bacterium]
MSATVRSSLATPDQAFGLPPVPTLADVLKALDRHPDLTPRRRADLRSAVISVARILGLPPASTPARLDLLRRQLARVLPAAHDMTRPRWNTVRSLFGKALRRAGIEVLPGRFLAKLDPAWAALRSRLVTKTHRDRLSRLIHYCSANGIAPEAVDDVVIDAFREVMLNASLVRQPKIGAQRAVVCWNEAVDEVPGWPQRKLTVLELRDRYTLPLTDFPPSFQADVEAYLDHLAGKDPLVELAFRPQRPRTIETRRYELGQIASALVRQGRAPATIRSLADLVNPEAAKLALRFILARSGNKVTTQTGGLAGLLLAVARHWVKVDEATEAALKAITKRCRPPKQGMNEKNRTTLRQFDDPVVVRKLLRLPDEVLAELRHGSELTPAQAQRLLRALAIRLLQVAPIRLQNLAGLQLQKHLIRVGSGRNAGWYLHLPAEEVKNSVALEYPLPAAAVQILDVYLAKAHPMLAQGQSMFLFPGRAGGPRSLNGFGATLRDFVARETGIRITVHQFRHLAGFLYL